jgi:hypothetical protein
MHLVSMAALGGVAERLNAAALKAVRPRQGSRGFESHPLRFVERTPRTQAGWAPHALALEELSAAPVNAAQDRPNRAAPIANQSHRVLLNS